MAKNILISLKNEIEGTKVLIMSYFSKLILIFFQQITQIAADWACVNQRDSGPANRSALA